MTDIDKLQQLVEELKQATREARECLKDFRAMQREYRELSDDWETKAGRLMGESAEEAMKHYFEVVENAIKMATDAVYRRFDTLANIMMGEEKGKDSIIDLLRKKNEKEKAIREGIVEEIIRDELL